MSISLLKDFSLDSHGNAVKKLMNRLYSPSSYLGFALKIYERRRNGSLLKLSTQLQMKNEMNKMNRKKMDKFQDPSVLVLLYLGCWV